MDSTRPGAGDRTNPNNSARLRLVHPEVIAEGRQLNGKCLGANAFLASIVFFSTIPHVLWLAFHVSRFFGGFYISCHTYCMFLAVFAFCSSDALEISQEAFGTSERAARSLRMHGYGAWVDPRIPRAPRAPWAQGRTMRDQSQENQRLVTFVNNEQCRAN